MLGHAAFDVRQHLVADTDVGEGAAHHDFVVAAPRAVAVEILPGAPGAPAGSRRPATVLRMMPAGDDVVGRDAVAQFREDARARDVADRRRLHRDALEIGRVLHVGRAVGPAIGVAAGLDLDRLPLLRSLEHLAVAVEELVARQAGATMSAISLLVGQMSRR